MFLHFFLVSICALLGLPWFIGATVRSIIHVRSLMKESELRVPGERPQFLGVRYLFARLCHGQDIIINPFVVS